MTHNTREEVWEEELQNIMEDYLSHAEMRAFAKDPAEHMKEMREHWQVLKSFLHQELQKARHSERERIEAIFKEHVPPHAMDLEDSVWLKRLLNKAFGHENIY